MAGRQIVEATRGDEFRSAPQRTAGWCHGRPGPRPGGFRLDAQGIGQTAAKLPFAVRNPAYRKEQGQLALAIELQSPARSLPVHVDGQIGQADEGRPKARSRVSGPPAVPTTTRPARERSRSAKVARMGASIDPDRQARQAALKYRLAA